MTEKTQQTGFGYFQAFPVVALLFFLSGAFALIYEIAWVRALTLEFGSTALAVSTVIATFMGGLAWGAKIAGRFADQSPRPLHVYGAIEIALGTFAFFSPEIFRLFTPLFSRFGAAVVEDYLLLSVLRAGLTVALLLAPTLLMGATFPVLARFLAVAKSDVVTGTGLLYATNTFGAFVGCLLAGFVFLPHWGLARSLHYTAAANVLLGVVAVGLATVSARGHLDDRVERHVNMVRSWDPILLAVFLSGLSALACEIVWTRVLILTIGSSVYAFSAVLAVFLAGIGVGAALSAALLKRFRWSARTVFLTLGLGSGLLVCLSSILFPQLPALFIALFDERGFAQGPQMFWVHLLLSALIIFPPSVLMGSLFPIAVAIIGVDRTRTGFEIGRLYSYNTLGSIIGSVAAGFWGIPAVGIRSTLLAAASLQCVAGVIGAWRSTRGKRVLSIMTASAAIGVIWIASPQWHSQVMTSGVAVYGWKYKQPGGRDLAEIVESGEELLFYRDGLTATVTVTRDLVLKNKDLYISTNGKIDGSSHYDMPTQRLSGHLPILMHPAPNRVCVIGMGTGVTAGAAGLHGIDVTLLELEQAIVDGARLFAEHNNNVHDNDRVHIKVTDGRLYLSLHHQQFDVIISEPSNPWVAGTADLFTTDFYRIGADALRHDGIFAQWVQIYDLSSKNLLTMMRSFGEVFPFVYFVSTIPGTDGLLIGSQEQLLLGPKTLARRLGVPSIAADLADPRVGIRSVADLLARIWLGPHEFREFIGHGELHTDDLPVIAYEAPKDLYRSTRTDNTRLIVESAKGVSPWLDFGDMTNTERDEFLIALRESYSKFVPGRVARFYNRE